MAGYLIDKDKGKCYGCEACVQICPKSALKMEEDDEGFRYPILNKDLCVKCNLCHQVCLYENMPVRDMARTSMFLVDISKMKKYVLKALAAVHFQLLSILFAMTIM